MPGEASGIGKITADGYGLRKGRGNVIGKKDVAILQLHGTAAIVELDGHGCAHLIVFNALEGDLVLGGNLGKATSKVD